MVKLPAIELEISLSPKNGFSTSFILKRTELIQGNHRYQSFNFVVSGSLHFPS